MHIETAKDGQGSYEGYMIAVVFLPCQPCLAEGLEQVARGNMTTAELAERIRHKPPQKEGNTCPHCGTPYPPPSERRVETTPGWQGDVPNAG